MNTFKLNNFVCKCGIRVARYTKINEKSYEDVLKQGDNITKKLDVL